MDEIHAFSELDEESLMDIMHEDENLTPLEVQTNSKPRDSVSARTKLEKHTFTPGQKLG